ncbi:MAG: response regulator [Goleter apudmare HA4340-LM2]|jgi:DNA-binding response OmpR family regulator|nr:response regulator [Goleter apudmare HA4340-LM2]
MNQILIVEDEVGVVAFMEKGLRKQGYTTIVATDGQQALLVAESCNFDLMLLDLGLPFIDGLTVLKKLRSRGETRPIIIVTARQDEREQAIAFQHGANDYITKPFRFFYLLERIQAHLGRG